MKIISQIGQPKVYLSYVLSHLFQVNCFFRQYIVDTLKSAWRLLSALQYECE